MVRTSVRATVTRASSGRPMTFGTINDATMAMMTSTTIISISVTPLSRRARRGPLRAAPCLSAIPCPFRLRIPRSSPFDGYEVKLRKVSSRSRGKVICGSGRHACSPRRCFGRRRSARPATGRARRRRAAGHSGWAPTRWRCRASWRTSCGCRCRSPRIASGRPPPASRSRSSSPSRWRRRTSCWGRSSAGASISSSWWRIARWRSGPGARPPGSGWCPTCSALPVPAAGCCSVREAGGRVLVRRADGTGYATRAERLEAFWRADGAPQVVLYRRTAARAGAGRRPGPDARGADRRRRRASTCCRARMPAPARGGRRVLTRLFAVIALALAAHGAVLGGRHVGAAAHRRGAGDGAAQRAVGARARPAAVAAVGRGLAAGAAGGAGGPRRVPAAAGSGGGRAERAGGDAARPGATAPRTAVFRCRSRRPTCRRCSASRTACAERAWRFLPASRPPATARPRCSTGSREAADERRAASTWWGRRSGRERVLLAVMASGLAAYLLFVGAARPLLAARGEALATIARHEAALARLAALPDGNAPVASGRAGRPRSSPRARPATT